MPKRTPAATLPLIPQPAVPQMPDGYYSGDKPNANLRAFVEQHLREKPYDPLTDTYDVPAFDKPITTTKATAIYNMHTYWSKKPHDAIREYIRHYTQPGDLVLDPFCGSGSTALAALMEGRKAIAIDRSPAATFITKNYCTPVDVNALQAAFEELQAKVKPEIDWLYETRCDRCGGNATTAYTVYSQVFRCDRCFNAVPLFDCIEAENSQGKTVKVCPICQKNGFVEEISTRGNDKMGAIPVLVSYACQNGCKPARDERCYNDLNLKKREYFERYDLAKLREIESKSIPNWYPLNKMMNVEDDSQPWGAEWRQGRNFRSVAALFTKRNLWVLASLKSSIPRDDHMMLAFSAIIMNSSKLYRDRDGGGGGPTGNYYIPQQYREMSAWSQYHEKITEYLRYQATFSSQVCISTQTACDLTGIPSSSVDFVFTDPPYADKVQYGEMNFIWEAWLGLDTHWQDDEIIVNNVRGKTEADWAGLMRQAMAECYRVLKPGRWISLCYHDTSEGTWALLQNIMADAGFTTDQSAETLFIDTGQKSYNQLTADKVNKRDLVINFHKPKCASIAAAVTITGDEDATTFQEKVHLIIRAYLIAHPGATKDRIFDEVVSRMVRAGQMQAHDFDQLLGEVAEPSVEPVKKNLFEDEPPNLFGTHEEAHWHLRETEHGGEESQHELEEAAAEKIEQFLARQSVEELRTAEPRAADLSRRLADVTARLDQLSDPAARVEKPQAELRRLERESRDIKRQIDKLKAQIDEWSQNALHYTLIYEFYLSLVPKPRMPLVEVLEDFFTLTDHGNWRPPATDAERAEKAALRSQASHRHIRRYCRMLAAGQVIPPDQQPDSLALVEWIRYCKRAGLYAEGKLLFERGGLTLESLPEEAQINVEEDYQVCARIISIKSE